MGRPVTDLSEKERTEICELYGAGEPVGSISAAYGLSNGSVSKVARIAGMEPRQRRAARALENAAFDLRKLEIEAVDGEPRVRDIVLAEALGYERPRAIRDLIKSQYKNLQALGPSPSRMAMVEIGSGAVRQTTEHLLNLAQINYLITRCSLPNADEWCKQIALVFTAWQTGRLDDLETVVEIQDAVEAAESAVPDLAFLSRDIVETVVRGAIEHLATKEQVQALQKQIAELAKRRDCTRETKRAHIATVLHHYNGRCPCCSERAVVTPIGDVTGHFDHWTDCPPKNGAHETWLVCAECNTGFQTRRIDRQEHRAEFDVFQKRRKQIQESIQPPLI